MIHRSVILIISCLFFSKSFSQDLKGAKSILLYKKGKPLSYPIIGLNSGEKLELHFDKLTETDKLYYYSVIHCDANWIPSGLMFNDYAEGMESNEIYNYEYSVNTRMPYIHYSLEFPNDELKLLFSGNYIIKVFEEYKNDTPLFEKRFFVVENVIEMESEVKTNTKNSYRGELQAVNFSLFFDENKFINAQRYMTICIYQNNDPNLLINDIKPSFIRPGEFEYGITSKNEFKALNEYRNFNLKSLRYRGRGGKYVKSTYPYYNVVLEDDKIRGDKLHSVSFDINGKYFIRHDDSEYKNTEADYAFISFFLSMEPILTGKIYLYGALTDYAKNEQNKMKYNMEAKGYEKTLFLKQGFYDYRYVMDRGGFQDNLIEGSFYETENDYFIYVYYKDIFNHYDRLLGLSMVNSTGEVKIYEMREEE